MRCDPKETKPEIFILLWCQTLPNRDYLMSHPRCHLQYTCCRVSPTTAHAAGFICSWPAWGTSPRRWPHPVRWFNEQSLVTNRCVWGLMGQHHTMPERLMRSSSSHSACERHSVGKKETWWLWEPFNINDAKRIKNNSLGIHRQLCGDVKPDSGLLICFEFYSSAWSMIMSWHFFVLGQQGLVCSALLFCFHVWDSNCGHAFVCVRKFIWALVLWW